MQRNTGSERRPSYVYQSLRHTIKFSSILCIFINLHLYFVFICQRLKTRFECLLTAIRLLAYCLCQKCLKDLPPLFTAFERYYTQLCLFGLQARCNVYFLKSCKLCTWENNLILSRFVISVVLFCLIILIV